MQSFFGLSVPKGKVAIQSGCFLGAEDWLKIVGHIQAVAMIGFYRRKETERCQSSEA
jgi:hypothetical protein